ncbi:DUF2058 domain-containing protein [Xanthomonadaceae bacterium JHOS43]|nr:DUF2058 domain-containing protein [Xanthomonadaceae bacterium JHOS43]MCX7563618.1 DUF2058 domain-containing protein [Xanthomonadaceae bacterium XH05]
MRNALQEQLLKTGLAKKSKLDEVAREQARQRKAKGKGQTDSSTTDAGGAGPVDAERLRQQKIERDRTLEAERKAQTRRHELQAQARQIIEQNRVQGSENGSAYRFNDGEAIRSLLTDDAQRPLLAKGALVIVRFDEDYVMIPRAAADKVRERLPEWIIVDHAQKASGNTPVSDDDDYYSRFVVPDDLIW